jgi:predicted Zn finger-like uncharacterized protein
MRIVCDGCGAKYQVDDDKVLNRSFKFPCKKCGEKIIVRQSDAPDSGSEPADDGAEQGSAFEATAQLNYEDHLAQQAEDEGAVWYVAVGQDRVGPVTANDVQSYIDQGQVASASFVWCDGMDDWAPLESVPALARLLPVQAEVSSSTNPFSEAASPYSNELEVSQPEAESAVENDADDLFVSEKREATFDEPPNSPVMSTAQLTGQRHENSVLFSLDSLDNEQPAQSSMMSPSATGNTEASGLIDLAMLTGDGDNLDSIFNHGAPNAAPMGAPIKPMASLVTQPKSNRIGLIIAVVAILVAGLTGGVVWFLLKPQQAQTPAVAAAPSVAPVVKAAPKTSPKGAVAATKPKQAAAPVATKPVESANSQGKKGAGAATKAPVKAVVAKAKPKKRGRTTNKRGRKRKGKVRSIAKKAAPAPLPRAKPKRKTKSSGDAAALLASLDGGGKKSSKSGGGLPTLDTPAVDPTLPERLDRGQVLRSIRRHLTKVKDCRRLEPDIAGQVTVRFTVNGNGRVSGTKTTGQYANTPIGNCVAQKVRAIRFPRFSGSPFPINFPFSL